MKGRYSESCRITLHEENFFMREEMTMAYTFSRLIFYAEFKNDNLFDVRSKSKEPLIDYKMYTFLKWPKSWPQVKTNIIFKIYAKFQVQNISIVNLGRHRKSVQTMHGRFGFTLTLLCYSGRWVGWCDILADMQNSSQDDETRPVWLIFHADSKYDNRLAVGQK